MRLDEGPLWKKEKGEWERKVGGYGSWKQRGTEEAVQILPFIPELFSQMKTLPSLTREEESLGWLTRAATAMAPSSTSHSSQFPTWTKNVWLLGMYAQACICCST